RGEATGRLVVAHYNHGLRGAESDADEEFVVALAHSLACECRVGRASQEASLAQAEPLVLASEEASRATRYSFLTEMAKEVGARYVATAHTADDQAETVLHRVLRGTGLLGLAGMPRARALAPGLALVRPLLAVRREQVQAYLAEVNQTF